MPKPVRKDGERLTVTIAKDKSSGTYGIALAQTRLGSAVVTRLESAAEKAAVLEVNDRIVHVNEAGPLDYEGVVSALRKESSPVKLTIVRGEPPEPMQATSRTKAIGIFGLLWLIVAIAFADLDPFGFVQPASQTIPTSPEADRTSARIPEQQQARSSGEPPREAASQQSSARSKRGSGTAIDVGGQRHEVKADGSAVDPDALRAAMRADKRMMRDLRTNKPEWATVISGFQDGSYDVKRFQKVLRENYKNQQLAHAAELHDDGSAKDPVGYLELLKREKGRKWLKTVKEHSREMHDKVVDGDADALQEVLRATKRRRDEEESGASTPPPSNPPTPYDTQENLKVGMSMRILTDEGEEKDLYQVMPEETEEEKWHMPREMRCTACQAVAHQAAKAVHARHQRRHRDELVGIVTLEALQDICANTAMWTQEYGLMPTNLGINVYNGSGIELPDGAEFRDDVMISSQHSDKHGRSLGDVCKALVLSAEAPEEDEFASLSLSAGSEEEAVLKYRKFMCDGYEQPCDPDLM